MADHMVTVYYADDFSYHEQKPLDLVMRWHSHDYSVDIVDMPTPTRRHPEKTKKVYKWIGEHMSGLRDDSLQMPPRVTERAAEGHKSEKEFAFSYRGIMIAGRRAFMVPA